MESVTGVIKVKVMCIVLRNGVEVLAGLGHDDVTGDDFGRLIGGHVEFSETAEAAVRREFREELNTELENLSFVQVIENIFTYNGVPGHEVIFLFRGDLEDRSLYTREKIPIADAESIAEWLPIRGPISIYPAALSI
jgi:8-oxo-dGTP pyrophosphatase MutT (NUDIX family)